MLLSTGNVFGQIAIDVQPLQGGRDVSFGEAQSLGFGGEAQSDYVVREVEIVIDNDSGKIYRVYQSLFGPWQNEEGEDFPVEEVDFYIISSNGTGTVRFPSTVSLQEGEVEIFISDDQGSDERLIITYTVRVPVGQKSGYYRSNLTFRVVTQ